MGHSVSQGRIQLEGFPFLSWYILAGHLSVHASVHLYIRASPTDTPTTMPSTIPFPTRLGQKWSQKHQTGGFLASIPGNSRQRPQTLGLGMKWGWAGLGPLFGSALPTSGWEGACSGVPRPVLGEGGQRRAGGDVSWGPVQPAEKEGSHPC